ncbi:hypothetical protein SDC9_167933 [bioreactor metagenome]|uniref:Uncharacterized protein n=1 Tax=bioreactor metagenome TaxID=1076179 RepID=A0A645G8Z5_9ZZZZ
MRRLVVVELVRHQDPAGHGQEGQAEHPAHYVGADQMGDPGPHRTGGGAVEHGGDEDAGDDRPGALEAGGRDEGEQLGFVADFSEGDDAGGDEKGFHEGRCGGR